MKKKTRIGAIQEALITFNPNSQALLTFYKELTKQQPTMKNRTTLFVQILGAFIIIAAVFLTFISQANAQEPPKEVKTCQGTTKAKEPCKSVIIMKSGYCASHDPNAIKCAGKNAAGKNCGMTVKEKGLFCRHHQDGNELGK